MKLDDLAYKLFIEKFGFISIQDFKINIFMKNKNRYKSYYDKANKILRKEKLKTLKSYGTK